MPLQVVTDIKILEGESLSNAVDTTAGTMVRLTMPAAWDPCNITFQISSDGNGFNDLFGTDGEEIVMQVVPGTGVVVPIDWMRGVGFIKFRSGRRDNPIAQTADREFSVAIEVPATIGANRSL